MLAVGEGGRNLQLALSACQAAGQAKGAAKALEFGECAPL